ncbi:hypothetical protein [Rhizobium nepotum]|uniref:hypothetical protein n=1 Tax=Rhizobium nepotum TaxID=1035271 RepID=UPI003CE8E5B3
MADADAGEIKLGIYEGCHVELRNGSMVGPVTRDGFTPTPYIWDGPEGISWTSAGKVWVSEDNDRDIIRVVPKEALKLTMSKTYGQFSKFAQATIPPHVLSAAMDAGIRANPAYSDFVNAVLTAGFKAQYEIEFVPVVEKGVVDMDALSDAMTRALPSPRPLSECSDEMKDKMRRLAETAVSYLRDKQLPQNESES